MIEGLMEDLPPMQAAGIDITTNVNLRMAISKRLPESIRDEAIWQYHLRDCRGAIRWGEDQSFRYLRGAALDRYGLLHGLPAEEIRGMLAAYEPTKEALVFNEDLDSTMLLRIKEDGKVMPLWREARTLHSVQYSENGLSRGK